MQSLSLKLEDRMVRKTVKFSCGKMICRINVSYFEVNRLPGWLSDRGVSESRNPTSLTEMYGGRPVMTHLSARGSPVNGQHEVFGLFFFSKLK